MQLLWAMFEEHYQPEEPARTRRMRHIVIGVALFALVSLVAWGHFASRTPVPPALPPLESPPETPHPQAGDAVPQPPREPTSGAESSSPESWAGRCVGVTDGDTISVLHDGVRVKIRLNAVDCPEHDQAYGGAAKKFTSRMVFGKVVTVRPADEDRYGRTVANVLTMDGTDLNEALVAAGLAWWYRHYAPNNSGLEALENTARRSRRGLWADAKPVPPWEFRQTQRRRRAPLKGESRGGLQGPLVGPELCQLRVGAQFPRMAGRFCFATPSRASARPTWARCASPAGAHCQ